MSLFSIKKQIAVIIPILIFLGILAVLEQFYLGKKFQEYEENRNQIQLSNNLYLNKFNFTILNNYLSQSSSAKAHQVLKEMLKITTQLEHKVKLKIPQKLQESFGDFKKIIDLNSGHANSKDVLKVLNLKLQEINNLASQRGYPSVLSFSSKFKTQFSNSKNLSSKISFFGKELKIIQNKVKFSGLSDEEKQVLLTKVASLETEKEILSSLASHLNDSTQFVNVAQANLASWQDKLNNQLIINKSEINNIEKILMLLSIIILGFLLYLPFLIWVFVSQNSKQLEHDYLGRLVEAIEKGFFKNQKYIFESFPPQTAEKLESLASQLEANMSVGRWFLGALPIPCLILDQNHEIVWFNDILTEQLFIDKNDLIHHKIKWENVRSLFEISGEDPFEHALNGDIASVYPGRIDIKENGAYLPCEFYITSIKENNKSYACVVILPLVHLKDSLKQQRKILEQHMLNWFNSGDQLSLEKIQRAGFGQHAKVVSEKFQEAQKVITDLEQEVEKLSVIQVQLKNDLKNLDEQSKDLSLRLELYQDQFSLVGIDYCNHRKNLTDYINANKEILYHVQELEEFFRSRNKEFHEFQFHRSSWIKALDQMSDIGKEMKDLRWILQEDIAKVNKARFMLPDDLREKFSAVWNEYLEHTKIMENKHVHFETLIYKWKQQFDLMPVNQDLSIPGGYMFTLALEGHKRHLHVINSNLEKLNYNLANDTHSSTQLLSDLH